MAAVIELFEVFDGFYEVCEVIGRHEMEQVSLIDRKNPEKGIVVSYGGGELCENPATPFQPSPRRTSFELVCSSKQEENFQLIELVYPEYVACSAVFRIKTPAGCPQAYQSRMSIFWVIFIGGLVFVVGYVALGCLYNRYKFGAQGLEALPHSEFWMELTEKVNRRFRSKPDTSKNSSFASPSYDSI